MTEMSVFVVDSGPLELTVLSKMALMHCVNHANQSISGMAFPATCSVQPASELAE